MLSDYILIIYPSKIKGIDASNFNSWLFVMEITSAINEQYETLTWR